jgi:hypothetical protein
MFTIAAWYVHQRAENADQGCERQILREWVAGESAMLSTSERVVNR